MVLLLIGRRRDTKNPPRGGGCRSAVAKCLSRASTPSPQRGDFFRTEGCARTRDHVAMMRCISSTVNGVRTCLVSHDENHGLQTAAWKKPLMSARKKAGLMRAR